MSTKSTTESLSPGTRSAVSAARPLPLALLVMLRPKQWVKNLTCFAGVIFSGQLLLVDPVLRSCLGFVAFCCASSSIYVLNDLLDRKKDQLNERTRRRPIAAGEVPISLAVAGFALLFVLATGLSNWLGRGCLIAIGCYFGLNLLYSLWLKHAAVTEVMSIALGFVFRVLYGVYAVKEMPTAWIVLCMFFLAIFLGFAKRKGELASTAERSAEFRPVLQAYDRKFLEISLAMSATMTIVCYSLFAVASNRNPNLVITVVPVTYCVMRYMMLVMVQGEGESPESVLVKDRAMWVGILAWVILCVAVLYGNLQIFSATGHTPAAP